MSLTVLFRHLAPEDAARLVSSIEDQFSYSYQVLASREEWTEYVEELEEITAFHKIRTDRRVENRPKRRSKGRKAK